MNDRLMMMPKGIRFAVAVAGSGLLSLLHLKCTHIIIVSHSESFMLFHPKAGFLDIRQHFPPCNVEIRSESHSCGVPLQIRSWNIFAINAASKMAVRSVGPDSAHGMTNITVSILFACPELHTSRDDHMLYRCNHFVAACTYRLLTERNACGSTSSC